MENKDKLLMSKYMSELVSSSAEFKLISERWDILSMFDKMSDFHLDMSDTRKEFEDLTEQLLVRLEEERLKKLATELSSKAQVAVDIVIRNLFERTTDIGFLSTDDDIREYIEYSRLAKDDDTHQDKESELSRSLLQRFKEYVAKYSVYNNIVLFDTSGNIKMQLDQSNQHHNSQCAFIKEAISTTEEYVEFYGNCDISNDENNLIYAYKITKTNNPESEVIGVSIVL